MAFLRSALWLSAFVLCTFAAVVLFKHGPGDPTALADGARQEMRGLSEFASALRDRLPARIFGGPES